MNEEISPASETPVVPPILESSSSAYSRQPLPKPFSYWLKKLLVCNPFYLASAALFLSTPLSKHITGRTVVVDGGVACKFPYS